jgi:hypothetical protein
MNEPDDPGGTSPQVSNYVTISYNTTDMETDNSTLLDTDSSGVNNRNAKRKRSSTKICKHCNKKKRRNDSKHSTKTSNNENDCQCILKDKKLCFQIQSQPEPISSHTKSTELPNNNVTTAVARHLYKDSDVSPYVVHVQKEFISPNNKNTIQPVSFGHFLKKQNFKNIVNGSIKRIGRNRISMSFLNFEDANSFINNSVLSLNKYKAFIPTFNVTRMGIIRGVPSDWSDEEVMTNVSVPLGCGNILKIRRLKRKTTINEKVEFVPIETVVLTFDGQVLPRHVFLCYNALPVDIYIFPTIQCYNCCRYGHIKSSCRSNPRCFKCGQGHCGDNCSLDDEYFKCCLCLGSHVATSKNCPEFFRQKGIKETMAKSCISYSEALKLHPPVRKSYADIVITKPSQHNLNNSSINNNHLNKNSQITSYKKTTFLKPKSSPQISKGYDRAAHTALLKDFDFSSSENGCALINTNSKTALHNLPVKELIIVLIQSLCQNNLMSLPSNAASDNDNDLKFDSNTEPSGTEKLQPV